MSLLPVHPPTLQFTAYHTADRDACLVIFDANCPDAFLREERPLYAAFLEEEERHPRGYNVCRDEGRVVGAFGLRATGTPRVDRINWILIAPSRQRGGIGSAMVRRTIECAQDRKTHTILIATSPRAATFFARFGAEEVSFLHDGWGPGMHRVDMQLALAPP